MPRHVLWGLFGVLLVGCEGSSDAEPRARPGASRASELSCGGGQGGACECPANTGTDVYADPVSGSPAGASPSPTGVAEPPHCRFSTLTAALNAAGPGQRVVAMGAGPGAPAVFAHESFPLLVTGKTLTTVDAPLNPANYLIHYTGAPPGAVLLYTGARLEGFTVLHTAHQSSTSFSVSCGQGAIGLDSVVLEANGFGVPTGVAVAGTSNDCSAALSNATVRGGFFTGININTVSSALNTVTGGLLEETRGGFVLQQGKGRLEGVLVRNNQGSGVSVSPSAAGLAPELTLTETVITGNSGAGLLVSAGSGGAPLVSVSGGEVSGHGTSAFLLPGVDLRAGQLSLTGVLISGNTGGGLVVRGGSGQVGAGTVLSNNGSNFSRAGIELTGGTLEVGAAAVQGNQGGGLVVSGGTLSVDGLLVEDNKLYGLQIKGGTALLESTTVTGTTGVFGLDSAGVWVEGGSLTLGAGTAVTNGSRYGVHALASATIAGTAGAPVRISGNKEGGILVDLASGNFTVRHAVVSGNGNGNNGNDPTTDSGIEVLRASSLRVEDSLITGNIGYGLFLRSKEGDVSATLERNEISRNEDTGIYISQGSQHTTIVALRDNEVFRNNTAGAGVGGIHISGGTLQAFTGNAVGGNTTHQLYFGGAQNGLSPGWDISAGNCTDGTANTLYCYLPGGGYGLSALPGISVDARGVFWESATPTAGTDYDAASGALFSVSPACGAASRGCPP